MIRGDFISQSVIISGCGKEGPGEDVMRPPA